MVVLGVVVVEKVVLWVVGGVEVLFVGKVKGIEGVE